MSDLLEMMLPIAAPLAQADRHDCASFHCALGIRPLLWSLLSEETNPALTPQTAQASALQTSGADNTGSETKPRRDLGKNGKQKPHAPLVVITASTREAENTVATMHALGRAAALLPSWETLPHERLSPRPETMAQRITTLRRIVHPRANDPHQGPLDVVVLPVRSLLQPLIPGLAEIEPLELKVGDEIALDDVVNRLVELGYQRTDMVAKRGDIAVRGGLVDVFAPTDPHPIRIEFFGDEVDELRFFSIADQRSLGAAENGLYAPGCQELRLSDAVRERAEKAITELPGAAEILGKVATGIAAAGMESLAPILCGRMETIMDLLPAATTFCISDPELVARRASDLEATALEFQEAAWNAAAAGGSVPLQTQSGDFLDLEELKEQAQIHGHGWWEFSQLPSAELAEADNLEDATVVGETAGTRMIEIGGQDITPYRGDIARAVTELQARLQSGWRIVVAARGKGSAQRLAARLNEAGLISRVASLHEISDAPVCHIVQADIGVGFMHEGARLELLAERDFTGRVGSAQRAERKMPSRRRQQVDPLQLKAGDFVVHDQHGVGRFVEMVTRTTGKGNAAITREYVVIAYAPSKRGQPEDRLYVPTDSLEQLSKYIGGDAPALNKIGGADWEKTKQKARKAVREIAAELVRLYAVRQATQGYAFGPDTPWQAELEDSFEYVETPDQLTTIDEVKADMEKPIPMDRLLCGDVGYGKTEIAVRAAFKAVQDGKQVAVLVPTTILAQQHYETFSERYANFPVKVAVLSRFSTKKEAEEVKEGVSNGSIDVVIGTHTLVTGQVRFKDLGLVIIDEEQRFGVEHKETLKALRANVDVLSMSATPIPRTLEMAVTGIRQMSTLTTPPEERHPVLTFVGPFSRAQMGAAIRRELMRDGQVFVVHNRVESIDKFAAMIQETVPTARVRVAHGQMSESQLERVIVDFWNREFDVLVCTTIVETGLDIANANTLIVDRADRMGLSQLHQLRGRVGRSHDRAYAYFFYPGDKPLTETAHERLSTIAANTDLGAGMAVAQKDLEIRGAGNLLGGQQSGHIAGVGFDLYVRMVAEAVAAFKGGKDPEAEEKHEVKIELPIDAHLPEHYIPGERLRLEIYAKLSAAATPADLAGIREELEDRYGRLPLPAERLFLIASLRQKVAQLGITEVASQGRFIRFSPVELAESQMLRLKRLYPGAMIKAAVRQVRVPVPAPKRIGDPQLADEALIAWINELVDTIFVPFGTLGDADSASARSAQLTHANVGQPQQERADSTERGGAIAGAMGIAVSELASANGLEVADSGMFTKQPQRKPVKKAVPGATAAARARARAAAKQQAEAAAKPVAKQTDYLTVSAADQQPVASSVNKTRQLRAAARAAARAQRAGKKN